MPFDIKKLWEAIESQMESCGQQNLKFYNESVKYGFIQYVPYVCNDSEWAGTKCHYEFHKNRNNIEITFHCEGSFSFRNQLAKLILEHVEFSKMSCKWQNIDGGAIIFDKVEVENDMNAVAKKAVETMIESVKNYGETIQELITKSKDVIDMSKNKIDDLKKLLENNHNIILHGAPGTGKTYLAKEIASQMIFGCSLDKLTEDQNLELKQQIGFVQFHQSYDYTDFVEGLRPVKGRKGLTEGFARQNGVFKEFCCKALSNEIISSKTPEDIKKESEWRKKIDTYLEKFKNENPGLKTSKKKNDFSISDFDEELVYINSPSNPKTSELFCKIDDLVQLLSSNKEFKSVKDLEKFFKLASHRQIHSYEIVIVNKIRDQERQQPIQIEIVEDENVIEPIEIEKKKDFIFIIDEINRGEMSKIFGELFYSIDPGYRGENGRINTQYQNLVDEDDVFADGFFVPENVYIIGTMNDIDRSVESMDFAMRRRFAFKEISAEDSMSMLDNPESWKNAKGESVDVRSELAHIKNRMLNLNDEILKEEFNLGSSYQIGAAYFLKFAKYFDGANATSAFNNLWDYHLEGVLREYLRGMSDVDGLLEKLKTAYDVQDYVLKEKKSESTEG